MHFRPFRWVPLLGFPSSIALLLAIPALLELGLLVAPAAPAAPSHASLESAVPLRLARMDRNELDLLESALETGLEDLPHGSEIFAASRRAGLDPLLVAAVVAEESSFRADAVSPRGALGLMQLMPYHFEPDMDPFDPATNLQVGTQLLAALEQRFEGDLARALVAYHAGPRIAERSTFAGLPGETRTYLERVLRRFAQHHAQRIERGFGNSASSQREEFGRSG